MDETIRKPLERTHGQMPQKLGAVIMGGYGGWAGLLLANLICQLTGSGG